MEKASFSGTISTLCKLMLIEPSTHFGSRFKFHIHLQKKRAVMTFHNSTRGHLENKLLCT